MSKTKYKIHISYDGTAFCGWQKQPNGPTIQETLEASFRQITQEKVSVIGSGRTDAGVHAYNQVAHFYLQTSSLSTKELQKALNGVLPQDIRIMHIEIASDSFHARYSATSKEYHYCIYNSAILSPFLKHYSYHYKYPINLDLMQQAAHVFVGVHDFKNFANTGRAYASTVRHIFSIDIEKTEFPLLKIKYSGNGFLYKMVRNITGVLLAAGTQKLPIENIPNLLNSPKKIGSFTTAPAHGLFLYKVFYDNDDN